MCPRKQTTEPNLLILVSFFSGEVTIYTAYQLLHPHNVGSMLFRFLWATLYKIYIFYVLKQTKAGKINGISLALLVNFSLSLSHMFPNEFDLFLFQSFQVFYRIKMQDNRPHTQKVNESCIVKVVTYNIICINRSYYNGSCPTAMQTNCYIVFWLNNGCN